MIQVIDCYSFDGYTFLEYLDNGTLNVIVAKIGKTIRFPGGYYNDKKFEGHGFVVKTV